MDRPHRGGGGLAFLIRDVNYKKISMSIHDSDLEIVGSDHLPILIKVHIKSRIAAANRNFWSFKKAKWENIFVSLLSVPLAPRTLSDDLEQKWYTFKYTIINASHKSIPRGKFWRLKSFFQHRNPELRNLILKGSDIHRSLSRTTDPKTSWNVKTSKPLQPILELRLSPTRMEESNHHPILKPGKDTSSPESFRPIASASFVRKLMEKLVLPRLEYHLYQRNSMVLEDIEQSTRFCFSARNTLRCTEYEDH
ncbi:hypothetical protein TNCV_4146151 [Trichonephila clavipes]|nr:hypothetical protein TNCV_4146151 [Trichonephila clavipes]